MLFGLFEKMGQFIYTPDTYWGRLLSPTFNFGCNVDDEPIEAHVKSKVGSYGSQLNRVIDAVAVLVQHAQLDASGLADDDREALARFRDLDAQADAAARGYSRGDAVEQARRLARTIAGLQRSRETADAEACAEITRTLLEALQAAPAIAPPTSLGGDAPAAGRAAATA